jgi:hypothetical protein
MALNGGSKKFKLDKVMPHLAPPSKVVHIRNIPSHIPESDVVQLGLPFGKGQFRDQGDNVKKYEKLLLINITN